MIGKLDPEERIMEDAVSAKRKALAICNLGVSEKLLEAISQLGWDCYDNVVVEIGGVAATGTATNPDANPKWAKPFGTVTYQKDAFIVIKNRSRDPKILPPNPDPDLKQHHPYVK